MGLHRVHLPGGEARVGQGRSHDPLLREPVRRGETVGRAVLVDGRAPDQCPDPPPVAQRVRQPLQDQHTRALAPGGSVGRLRERLAPPVGRQAPLPGDLHEQARARQRRHPAGQRQRAFAGPQGAHGLVDGDQRGGAGRVGGHRRALKAQHVRHPARGHAGVRPGDPEALALGRRPTAQPGTVVDPVDAGEHARVRSPQGRGVDPRALQGLPGGLQHQALLGVHRQRLARADAEERRVELRERGEEPAPARVRPAGRLGVRVVQRLHVPAAVPGKLPRRVHTGGHHIPQLLWRRHSAREAAPRTHDGDGLASRLLQRAHPLAQFLRVTDGAPQVGPELVDFLHWVSFTDDGANGRCYT